MFPLVLAITAVGVFARLNSSTPTAGMTPQFLRFHGGGYDVAGATAHDSIGNFYVTGAADNQTSGSNFLVVKYGPEGNVVWRAHPSGTLGGKGLSIAVDRQGNVYVAGYNSNLDYLTVKFDANGIEQWSQRYNGPANGYDQATEIGVDSAGNIYTSGFSYGQGFDWTTLKYSSDGALLWERRHSGPGNWDDRIGDMALDAEGGLILTGFTKNTGDGRTNDVTTLKYNAEGNVIWERHFTETAISHEFANDMDVDERGNIYITGTTAENHGPYVPSFPVTLKYDRDGNLLRTIRDEAAGGHSIVADNAGNFYVTGYFFALPDFSATSKYDSSANRIWTTRLTPPSSSSLSRVMLAVDSLGNTFASSTIVEVSTGVGDYITIKYAFDGQELWQHRFNGAGNGNDVVTTIMVDSVDNALVTGTSWGDYVSNGGTANDILTLKFDGGIDPIPQPLEAPSHLHATSVSANQLRLEWQDNSNSESGFQIERCQGAGCTNFVNVTTVGPNVAGHVDGGLARNTTYTYRVRAFTVIGSSEYSNIASGRTSRK